MPKKNIRPGYFVLDVGSGDNPHRRADVICDKFIEDIEHHRGDRPLKRDRVFVQADVEALPFKDKAFDYVICGQLIEHVENPGQALDELSRVGKAGYLSTQTEFSEFLAPYPAHRWVCALRNGKLIIKRRSSLHERGANELFGGVFWHLHQDRDFKTFMLNHEDLFWVAFEWHDRINYKIVDEDYCLYDYFDPKDIEQLIRCTPPEGIWEYLKRQGRIYLRDVNALNAAYNKLRMMWKPIKHRIISFFTRIQKRRI